MARNSPLNNLIQAADFTYGMLHERPQEQRHRRLQELREQELHEQQMQNQRLEQRMLEDEYETSRRQRKISGIAQRTRQEAMERAQETGEDPGQLYSNILAQRMHEDPEARELFDLTTQRVTGDRGARFEGFTDPLRRVGSAGRDEDETYGVLYRTSDGQLDVLSDGPGAGDAVFEVPSDPGRAIEAAWQFAPEDMEAIEETLRAQRQRQQKGDFIEQQFGGSGQVEGLERGIDELTGGRTVPEYAHDQLAPMEATLQASQALERHPEWQDRAAHQATDTARGALGEAGGRDDGVELGGALGTTGLLGAAQSVGDTVADGSLGTRAAGLAQTGYQHAANVGRGGVRALLGEDAENRLEGLSQSLEERISGAASGLRDAVTGSDAYQRAADTFDFVSRAEPTSPGQGAAFEEQGGGQPEGQDRLRELQDGVAEEQRPERSAAPTTLGKEEEQQLRRAYGQGLQRAQQAQDLDQRRQLVQKQQQKVGPIRDAVEQGVIDFDTGLEMLQAGDERELELREVDGDLVAVTHDPNDPDGSIRTQTVAGTEEGPLDEVRDHQALADYRDTVATQADIPQEGRSSFHAGLDMATQRGLIDPVSMTDQGLADTLRQVIQGDVGRFSSIRPGREYSSWEDVPAEAWVDATLAAHAGYEDLGDYRDEIAEPVSTMLEEHGMGASHEAQQRAASTMARLMRDAGVSQDRARQDVQEILQRHPQMLQLPPDRFNQFVNNLVANERQQGG